MQDVLASVHEEYQEQIKGLVDRLSFQKAAVKALQQNGGEHQQIINALNEEVAALRDLTRQSGVVEEAVKVPDRPLRKVRDIPQA